MNTITQQSQEDKATEIIVKMKMVLMLMRDAKPQERDELARRYAVSITDMEKVIAYFKEYVVQ